MLKRLEIQNLFDEYSYVIDWKQSAFKDLLYITAPNGMGKTTILKMIAGLASFTPYEYMHYPFGHVRFIFDGGEMIDLTRTVTPIHTDSMTDELPEVETKLECEYTVKKTDFSKKERYTWTFRKDKLVASDGDDLTNMMMLLQTDKCRFFPDDRVFKELESSYDKQSIGTENIKSYLIDLQVRLENTFVYKPDSIDVNEWNEEDWQKRKAKVLRIVDFLRTCDINIGGEEPYQNLQKLVGADLIFLIKRYENAIRENKESIDRLITYRTVMDRFKFIGTELKLSPRYGYRLVKEKTGDFLQFYQLASGERHLLCLMNGLFFIQTESQLVLIDEPEMSYHMYWQIQFCRTIKEIVKKLHLRALMATHSPQMFDDDFSLTVDLWEQWDKQRRGK